MKSQSKSHPKKGEKNFFEKVYEVTLAVPHGRVTTYGAIARYIGAPGASRMVGWALNSCHTSEIPVPAHRVVNRMGMLSGKHHFRHSELMQQLLESEGVTVKNDKVEQFKILFWDPSSELV
jgi:methylated-DNA-protein-cysteine methyltransferase related protein